MGKLEEQEGYVGETVKHVKRGGASSLFGRRGGTAGKTSAVDETVERNMKEETEFATHFFEEHRVRRVLIGGSDDNVAQFRNLLPKAWQSLVVGVFPMSMAASHADVLAKTLEIGRLSEQQREKKLVENLITTAAKKGEAVIGMEETLKAINDSRVKTLVVMENWHQEGYRCPECNSLTTQPGEPCDGCGGKAERLEDVIEAAVAAVLRHGGEVEVIGPHTELEAISKVGALLRY
jgi:peptide chain release factor subunit 1